MKKIIAIATSLLVFVVAGCSVINMPVDNLDSSNAGNSQSKQAVEISPPRGDLSSDSLGLSSSGDIQEPELTLTDDQGAVIVTVTPKNLDKFSDVLIFDVSMNTHSVDLSMDLTEISVLETDLGSLFRAIKWEGAQGGHHIEGKLTFAKTTEEDDIFNGARSITLKISGVDVPLRTFTWQISD